MLAVDIVGVVITICLVGLRYPQHVLGAALIHDLGQLLMTLFLRGHIVSVVAAGAFGSTVATGVKSGMASTFLLFSGSIANYIVSATVGGVEYEKTARLLNPLSPVKHPFAVVNFRLAVVSFLVNLWQAI
ncbi:MAG: hypothetical protein P4N59_22080 [Negativicutes bacterium]|nr:hypothetical protein [Negativicutes bacterium]